MGSIPMNPYPLIARLPLVAVLALAACEGSVTAPAPASRPDAGEPACVQAPSGACPEGTDYLRSCAYSDTEPPSMVPDECAAHSRGPTIIICCPLREGA